MNSIESAISEGRELAQKYSDGALVGNLRDAYLAGYAAMEDARDQGYRFQPPFYTRFQKAVGCTTHILGIRAANPLSPILNPIQNYGPAQVGGTPVLNRMCSTNSSPGGADYGHPVILKPVVAKDLQAIRNGDEEDGERPTTHLARFFQSPLYGAFVATFAKFLQLDKEEITDAAYTVGTERHHVGPRYIQPWEMNRRIVILSLLHNVVRLEDSHNPILSPPRPQELVGDPKKLKAQEVLLEWGGPDFKNPPKSLLLGYVGACVLHVRGHSVGHHYENLLAVLSAPQTSNLIGAKYYRRHKFEEKRVKARAFDASAKEFAAASKPAMEALVTALENKQLVKWQGDELIPLVTRIRLEDATIDVASLVTGTRDMERQIRNALTFGRTGRTGRASSWAPASYPPADEPERADQNEA